MSDAEFIHHQTVILATIPAPFRGLCKDIAHTVGETDIDILRCMMDYALRIHEALTELTMAN